MVDKWETQVGQLRLVGGSRVEDPANLHVVERRSLLAAGKGKGRLHILVELGGASPGREELCQDLVSAIAEEYYHAPGTVTYGLRQALLVANTMLLRANAQVGSEDRLGGAACVVLRAGEAFIAQAGWPMVYVIHQDQVQAFPDTFFEDEDISILGQRQTAEIRLFRIPIHPGDTILLADGPMAQRLGLTQIDQIVSGSLEQVMRNLETVAPLGDCTAMVSQVGSSYASTQVDQWAFTPVEQPAASQAKAPEPSPRPPTSEADYPSPEEKAGESFTAVQDQVAFADSIESDLGEEPVSVALSDDQSLDWDPPVRRRTAPSPRSRERTVPGSTNQSPSRVRSRHSNSTLGGQAQAALTSLADNIRALGKRMLPDRKPQSTSSQRRRTAGTRREHSQEPSYTRWAVIAAVAIPVIALLFVGGYTAYRNWALQSQFSGYMEQAKLKRDIAVSSTSSPAVAREYWLDVLAELDRAAALQPEHVDVVQMRAQARVEIDRIDGMTRLEQIYKLYEYTASESRPSRVIVDGLDIYVLDHETELVYHHTLNDQRNALRNQDADPVLAKRGQPIQGHSVGDLLDMVWLEEGGERQSGTLLILDRNGLLFEYDPTWQQFSSQAIGGQDIWRNPVALRTFEGNLYILDPMANQIFKYWKQQYANAPDHWVKQADTDLTRAIDIAIDGNIYALNTDGKLTKYFGGQVATFELAFLVRPLVHADALYLDLEEVAQFIYVADASERRIVQYDRQGAFVRQFQPVYGREDFFRQLAGIFVDERGGKLYYTAANALYVADIPPLQR